MNKQMKRWLENAIFLGFTGTPLLRKDKQNTRDVFGTYIHTYKFREAVMDKVILDLKYEARDVPQRLTSPQAVDAWFEQKTKALNNFQRAVLRKRKPLPVGTTAPPYHRLSRNQAVRFPRPQAHHAHSTPRQ